MTIRAPAQIVGRVRFLDRAASEQKPGTYPDATVGLLLSKDAAGTYFARDSRRFPVAKHDDQVDALSGAHGMLTTRTDGVWTAADIAACVAISGNGKLPTDFAWPDPEYPDMEDLEVKF